MGGSMISLDANPLTIDPFWIKWIKKWLYTYPSCAEMPMVIQTVLASSDNKPHDHQSTDRDLARTWLGWTPLHWAADNASKVVLLLDQGHEPNVADKRNRTRLMLAAGLWSNAGGACPTSSWCRSSYH